MDQRLRRNLVIIPTRGRVESVKTRVLENARLSKDSDYCISVDTDEEGDYSWVNAAGLILVSGPPEGMNAALNRAFDEVGRSYEFVSFMGDDHSVRTLGWDALLIESISTLGFGVAYGDDLLTHGKLPTFAMISGNVAQGLGFIAPPSLRHMYLDDYWLRLGKSLNACFYRSDVVVEHMHHSVGKSDFDDTYKATNRHLVNLRDRVLYYRYLLVQNRADVRRVRLSLGLF